MGFAWLAINSDCDFYLACRRHFGFVKLWGEHPTDDQVATYCAGGEL